MKIIDNYRKLPIGKYNEIVKLCETEMDEVDRKVRIVGILTGLTDDEVLALPLTDFTECCAKAKFIDLPCPETLIPSVSKSYPVGGFNLVPVTDMRKVTTAQYIDFLSFWIIRAIIIINILIIIFIINIPIIIIIIISFIIYIIFSIIITFIHTKIFLIFWL